MDKIFRISDKELKRWLTYLEKLELERQELGDYLNNIEEVALQFARELTDLRKEIKCMQD